MDHKQEWLWVCRTTHWVMNNTEKAITKIHSANTFFSLCKVPIELVGGQIQSMGHNVLKSVVRWEKGERTKMLLYSLCVLPTRRRISDPCTAIYKLQPDLLEGLDLDTLLLVHIQ